MKNKLGPFRALLAGLAIAGLVSQQGSVDAAVLNAQVQVQIKATLSNTLDLQSAASPLTVLRTLNLTNGTGGNQANVVWSDTRQLAASTTEDLDFAGGGLVDAFGAAVAPARIRAVLIVASCANTNNIVALGDANSIPFLGTAATTVTIQPCGFLLLTSPGATGAVVTAATGDIIQIANGGAGTPVTYDIVVLGTTS